MSGDARTRAGAWILNRNGVLYVMQCMPYENEPMIAYLWWRVVGARSDRHDLADQSVSHLGEGRWLTERGVQVSTGPGDTQAEHVDRVSAPWHGVRAGIEVRWYRGRWEKYLKSKGGWIEVYAPANEPAKVSP